MANKAFVPLHVRNYRNRNGARKSMVKVRACNVERVFHRQVRFQAANIERLDVCACAVCCGSLCSADRLMFPDTRVEKLVHPRPWCVAFPHGFMSTTPAMKSTI